MLKIIKYLSYNKNKSKKNYNKCTKFKVLINFITNSYLLGIQKFQKLKMMKEGGRVQKLKRRPRFVSKGQTGLRDRDSRRSGQTGGQRDCDSTGETGHGHGERPRFVFSNKMSYLNK